MYDTIVAVCAIIGAVLGIYNTFFQNRERISLEVSNSIYNESTNTYQIKNAIPVTLRNLTSSSIMIDEFGIIEFSRRELFLLKINIFSSSIKRTKLSVFFKDKDAGNKIAPYTSIVAYLPSTSIIVERYAANKKARFYAVTGDGRCHFCRTTTPADIAASINNIKSTGGWIT